MVDSPIPITGPFTLNNLIIYEDKNPVEFPPNVKKTIERFWEKEIKKNQRLFNGTVYSLTDFYKKNDNLFLTIKKTNFKSYLGTNLNPDFEDEKYFANVLGLNILLKTSDNFFIMGKRSSFVAEMKNMWHCIGGNLDSLSPYKNAIKELREEINVDKKFILNTIILGIVKNAITRRNELVFYVQTNLYSEQIKENLKNATDKNEHTEIAFLNREQFYDMQFKKDVTLGTQGSIKLFFSIYKQ